MAHSLASWNWSTLRSELQSKGVAGLFDPWPLFERLWLAATGYPSSKFHFNPGTTPMASLKETITAIVLYYAVIFGGQELMRPRPAMKLNNLFIIHNFYLTAISAALLGLFLTKLVPSLLQGSLFDHLCRGAGHTQPLHVLYYLNYLTKYLELLDTLFLVLKKKPLTFLHTYHHGATALLCYTQLVGETDVSWVPVTLNLGVHVVMYWYYYQAARGIKVWWKQYITILQILQFILDLGFIYFASYTHFVGEYFPSLPHVAKCGSRSQETAAVAGVIIISSYLVLFGIFYRSTYKKPSPAARSKSKSKST